MLAHELQHALDLKRVALDLLEPDCVALEARGFEAQAPVSRQFWPNELPNDTVLERHITAVVQDYEENGSAGLPA